MVNFIAFGKRNNFYYFINLNNKKWIGKTLYIYEDAVQNRRFSRDQAPRAFVCLNISNTIGSIGFCNKSAINLQVWTNNPRFAYQQRP